MQLLHKLMKFRAALDNLIEPLDALLDEFVDGEENPNEAEPEIVLRRSQKDRRSDKNTVIGMTPLNGAPSVPESWTKAQQKKGRAAAIRPWLYKTLKEYEPMTRPEMLAIAREELGEKVLGRNCQSFHDVITRYRKRGLIRIDNKNRVHIGKE